MPETFDSEIPATWAIFPGENGLGAAQTWGHNAGGFPLIIWEDVAGGLAEDWLVTPQVSITAATNLLNVDLTDLNAGNFNSNISIRVSDGLSQTTIADFSAPLLTVAETDIATAQTFQTFTVDLSAYIGSSVYIAFIMTNDDGDGWILDNVDLTGGCANPTVTFDDFTQTTADISMATSGNYDVEWGIFPYTQGSGGSTATVTGGDTYQLTGLTSGISYNVFVRQDCGGGEFSNYTETIVGTSPSNLNTLPYTEDVEPDANQALLLNFGFSFAGTGSWNFNLDDNTDGDTTNDFSNDGLASLFANNTTTTTDADAWLYIGPFNLTTDNEYTFSFFQRNLAVASATRPNKDIEIAVSTTNDGTGDTILLTLDDLDNIGYLERMVTYTPTVSGDFYFGIHDKSSFLASATAGNSVFVDTFSVTSQPLSIDEFDQNTFTHSYSKTQKMLNLESSNMAMTGLNIYSILGQKVASRTLAGNNASIDVSSLTDGIYLAKVNIGGNSKTIKFVKN
ncbi:hypothetical protein WPG_0705 [Winogradskyella sp. PG-2]|nr:hypothetical protein WPG_0705 [Winogradskyella sp. PG-2]